MFTDRRFADLSRAIHCLFLINAKLVNKRVIALTVRHKDGAPIIIHVVGGCLVVRAIFRLRTNERSLSISVGRGQCLRSKLATERSGVCLHPAVTLFALSYGGAGCSHPTKGFLSRRFATSTPRIVVCSVLWRRTNERFSAKPVGTGVRATSCLTVHYILIFSRVVEGADPYRDTEKPFFSSPPRGCANITREEQAPPLPRFVRKRLFVRSRKIVRTRMRAINDRPYRQR